MRSALTKLEGVESTKIDVAAGEVLVRFDAEKVKPEEMAQAVTDSGFDATANSSSN